MHCRMLQSSEANPQKKTLEYYLDTMHIPYDPAINHLACRRMYDNLGTPGAVVLHSYVNPDTH